MKKGEEKFCGKNFIGRSSIAKSFLKIFIRRTHTFFALPRGALPFVFVGEGRRRFPDFEKERRALRLSQKKDLSAKIGALSLKLHLFLRGGRRCDILYNKVDEEGRKEG